MEKSFIVTVESGYLESNIVVEVICDESESRDSITEHALEIICSLNHGDFDIVSIN